MTNPDATVYVLDDDLALSNALKWLFKSVQINVQVYNSPHDFITAYSTEWRGCLLLDMRMPFMSGFEVLEVLRQKHNRMPVIMLTGHGDVPMAVRAMKEGAQDFILKPFDDSHLLEKVQRAIAEDQKRQSNPSEDAYSEAIDRMTPREREVMELIAEGQLSKQIAAKLNISTSTVDFHRGNLMRKLNAKTLAELIKVYLFYANLSESKSPRMT